MAHSSWNLQITDTKQGTARCDKLQKTNLKNNKRSFGILGLASLVIDEVGRKILIGLCESPQGALGLLSLSKVVQLSTSTIQNVYESQLLQHGLISYFPRDRTITKKATDI